MTPRERFDPPLLRQRWTTNAALARSALLGDLAARSGWDAARIESLLWHGGLFLDGRPCSRATLPARVPAATRVDAYAFAWEPEAVTIGPERILRDTADWIAIDKPAWLTTQRSRASELLSAEAALRALLGDAALVAAHRLDRETSGVLVFAKGPAAAARLGRSFAEGRTRKRYLARVAPAPPRETWEIAGYLGRVLDPQRYRFALRDAEAPGFRASHTRFTRLGAADTTALVACEPTTGRSHQIRVHLAASGSPVAGDVLYGGIPGERTLLHAWELGFEDGTHLVAPVPGALLC